MKVCMVGTGYVGLVSGAGFAETGASVVCADIDANKIARLRAGEMPIFEPGLDELVARNVAEGRLAFSDDVPAAIAGAQVVFIGVGTPMRPDGGADLTAVDAVAQAVAQHATRECVLVCKSTVPVGTNLRVKRLVREAPHPVHVVSNPEFLKEGDAVNDFLRPDRIVVGVDDGDTFARDLMGRLYHPLCLDRDRIVWMDPASAELTKYVANTMLAMRISFMNEIAALCEKVGADVHQVRLGVGTDARIGPKFLYSGPGYGGSCLVGRETVLVRRDGRTLLTRLDELFAELAPDAPDTPQTVAVATPGLEILSWLEGDERPRFRSLACLTRRPYEGTVVDVRTKMGRRVRATADHPFLTVAADGSVGVTLASELTGDHWLPLARGREIATDDRSRLDLLAALPAAGLVEDDIIVRLGESGRAQLEAMGLDALAVALAPLGHPRGRERARDVLRAGACRLPEARHLGLSLDDVGLGTAKNGTYVPRWIPLDASFFRVVGLYLAEGHVSADGARRRITWSFHPTNEPELVDEVASFWAKLGVKADVRRGTTTMQVLVSSRVLAGLWSTLGLGTDCYDHRIPDLIWDRSEEERRAVLSGIWHGDGSWSFVNGGPSVVLEHGTVSRALADGMVRLLADLGVQARLKVGRTAKSTRDTYWLIVSSADNVERMIDLVPATDRETVLASMAKQSKRIAPTGTRDLGHPGAVAARIAQIDHKPFQGFVYSLEVPGAHTFVTSFGLVVHNCFPKDVNALVHTGREHGLELDLAVATELVNQRQKGVLFRKLKHHFEGDVRGRRVAVWGIAFKPRTDDIRDSAALTLIDSLLADGAKVVAHDPEAAENARARYGERVELVTDPYAAAKDADALVLVTEWGQYRNPDFERLRTTMRRPLLLDGRNIWSTYKLGAQGFTYEGIGVRSV